jgi:hypothetical protein
VNRVLIELALIALAACVGLALAWAHQADFFAISFAIAAALAIGEAGLCEIDAPDDCPD